MSDMQKLAKKKASRESQSKPKKELVAVTPQGERMDKFFDDGKNHLPAMRDKQKRMEKYQAMKRLLEQMDYMDEDDDDDFEVQR